MCGDIAEGGLQAAVREKEMRGWAWGALWKWIVGDEKRYGEYMQALEAFTQLKAHERLAIVDAATPEDVAVAKLRSETRRDFAGKVDKGRWGEQVTHNVSVDPFGEMLKRVSERQLARLRELQAPAIEGSAVRVEEEI